LGVVDLDGALRRDDADDHGSILAIIPDIAELGAILRLAFIFLYLVLYLLAGGCMSILIRGGTVINHDHSRRADVLIDGETVAAIGPSIAAPAGAEVIEPAAAM